MNCDIGILLVLFSLFFIIDCGFVNRISCLFAVAN